MSHHGNCNFNTPTSALLLSQRFEHRTPILSTNRRFLFQSGILLVIIASNLIACCFPKPTLVNTVSPLPIYPPKKRKYGAKLTAQAFAPENFSAKIPNPDISQPSHFSGANLPLVSGIPLSGPSGSPWSAKPPSSMDLSQGELVRFEASKKEDVGGLTGWQMAEGGGKRHGVAWKSVVNWCLMRMFDDVWC